MNNSNIEKIIPVFSAAFALIYIISVERNWALFTYIPKIGQWAWLVAAPAKDDGPPMFWYGWLVTSTLGASALSLISWPVLKNRPTPYWLGWVVPLLVIFSVFYFFRDWFMR
jgi:hypothetical protein